MAEGIVKWFNTTKGYGFIAPEGGEKDVFVHITALEQSGIKKLMENQRVSYELASSNGRSCAENIKLLG